MLHESSSPWQPVSCELPVVRILQIFKREMGLSWAGNTEIMVLAVPERK